MGTVGRTAVAVNSPEYTALDDKWKVSAVAIRRKLGRSQKREASFRRRLQVRSAPPPVPENCLKSSQSDGVATDSLGNRGDYQGRGALPTLRAFPPAGKCRILGDLPDCFRRGGYPPGDGLLTEEVGFSANKRYWFSTAKCLCIQISAIGVGQPALSSFLTLVCGFLLLREVRPGPRSVLHGPGPVIYKPGLSG